MPSTKSSSRLERAVEALGAALVRTGGPTLYIQISSMVRRQIQDRLLMPGDVLPTQRELARAWGVGEVTVRRALQKLAEEGLLEARPRAGTVVLDRRSRLTGSESRALTLGIAFMNLVDGYPFFPPVLAGLRAEDHQVAIRLFDLPTTTDQASDALAHAPPLAELDGLVMMSPVHLPLLARAQELRCPTVLLFSDVADGFSHCIVPDYARGVIEAVHHLVQTGRRRLALVTAGPERFSTGRWKEAFAAALCAHGQVAAPDAIVHTGYAERDGAEATRHLLARTSPPDAILYASDYLARGGLLAAMEAGLTVPRDLAIVGAGPTLDEGGWPVPLASIDLRLTEMGRLCRRQIAALRAGRHDLTMRQAVTSTYRRGATA